MVFSTQSRMRPARGTARTVVSLFTAVFVFAESARAQTCSELNIAEIQNTAAKARLLSEYPGTAATMFGCVVVASNQDTSEEKIMAMVGCAGLACVFIGINVCFDLAVEVISIAQRDDWIERRKRETDCT